MVMTHSNVKKQKVKILNIEPKADNPARLHMSHAEAVADNARLKAIKDKTEAYRKALESGVDASQTNDRDEDSKKHSPDDDAREMTSGEIKVANLESQIKAIRGPGARAKKKVLQDQIDAVKMAA